MLLPRSDELLCPSRLLPRDFVDDAIDTGKSFKSWDTCMDNKTCKIVAIVGFCLAGLVGIWIFGGLIRCLFCGIRGIGELFCCCLSCCKNKDNRYGPAGDVPYNREMNDVPVNSAYNSNPNMYPQKPAQAYDTTDWNGNYNYAPPPVQQRPMNYQVGVVSDEVPEKYDYHTQSHEYGGYRGGYR